MSKQNATPGATVTGEDSKESSRPWGLLNEEQPRREFFMVAANFAGIAGMIAYSSGTPGPGIWLMLVGAITLQRAIR